MAGILDDTKKILGLPVDDESFDVDVLTHINSALSTLNQLGIGPDEGFLVEDASPTWADFIGTDKRLNSVKTYVFLRVRRLFDPPATSFHLASMNEQIQELEWRLNTQRESTAWVPPEVNTVGVDGGTAVGG